MACLPLGVNYAPSVVIVSWQWSEHGNISYIYKTCPVICHCLMSMDRAWLYMPKVWNMLLQLSSSYDNGQSMVIYPSSMNHALSVDIISWQRSDHGIVFLRYETCSNSCHRLMTTVSAWTFIPKLWIMLYQLSSSHDIGQSMLVYHTFWNMVRRLSSSYDNGQSMVIHP